MNDQEQLIPLSEAEHEVELACRRIGMMHLAYAKTIMKELGPERGRQLILDSISHYGKMVGEQVKAKVAEAGLDNTPENYTLGRTLPKFGMNDGSKIAEDGKRHVYGCRMAQVWREFDEEALGNLYCYIDTAKYMWYNPDYKLTHVCSMPAHGIDYCEFELQKTTEQEKADFFANKDWRYLDPNITKED